MGYGLWGMGCGVWVMGDGMSCELWGMGDEEETFISLSIFNVFDQPQ